MLDTSKIYTSNNSGDFEVIEYINAKKVKIRFVLTGYCRFSEAKDIRLGQVKDRFLPSLLGVGFIGEGKHKSGTSSAINKPYYLWSGMLHRCYCPKFLKSNPSYRGCLVDSKWHNFQIFADWFYKTYPDDGGQYQLDKDMLSGNRVGKLYSEGTCKWLSHQENAEYSQAMTFDFLDPSGNKVSIFNLTKFCRENGLHQGPMSRVNNGGISKYKGWAKA